MIHSRIKPRSLLIIGLHNYLLKNDIPEEVFAIKKKMLEARTRVKDDVPDVIYFRQLWYCIRNLLKM